MPGRLASASKMPPNKRRRKQGGAAVPPLPPAIADEDIEVSDEDVEFVRQHKDYVGFLAQLDTKPMTRQVLGLKPDEDGEELETKYEKRAMRHKHTDEQLSVDPVDVLPVKTLIGELHFRSTSTGVPVDGSSLSLEERRASVRKGKKGNSLAAGELTSTDGLDETVKEKTKRERREEAKQLRKRNKQETPQEDVPFEEQSISSILEHDLERGPKLKARMAEIAVELLSDPNGNIMSLKELQDMCIDLDEDVSQLAMLSSMAVFKDLIPGYRIRLPTEKEREMLVSKEVRSLWDYETALLRFYQAYVKLLVRNAKIRTKRWTALRCLCGLLEAVPHFNYRESILSALVPRMGSDDDDCRNMCCEAIITLSKNPGRHGEDATVEAIQLIADFVRLRNCQLHPQVIQVFLALSFDDDLLKHSTSGAPGQSSEGHKKAQPKLSNRQEKKEKKGKKAKKQELAAQLRKEVEADFKEASVLPSTEARKNFQMLTISSLFETYFRILKTSLQPERASSRDGTSQIDRKQPYGPRPLLTSCLEGLARFSHLLSVDFMAPLLRVIQELAKGGKGSSGPEVCATVWERLQCCTIAFKIMRINMDVLNIDLREFYTIFYNLLLEAVSTSGGERSPEALAAALQIMLWDGTHNDMSRVAAFVKRLSTLALHLRSGEAVAVLATAQQLLMRYNRCRIIVENNPGSGPVSSRAMVLSDEDDPDLSDSLSTLLWELALLTQHYDPEVEKRATTIVSMRMSTSVVMPSMTPISVVKEYSSFLPGRRVPVKSNHHKQTRFKKQPLSPFLMTLEERSSRSNGGTPSKEIGEAKKSLFGGHFRVLKACRQLGS